MTPALTPHPDGLISEEEALGEKTEANSCLAVECRRIVTPLGPRLQERFVLEKELAKVLSKLRGFVGRGEFERAQTLPLQSRILANLSGEVDQGRQGGEGPNQFSDASEVLDAHVESAAQRIRGSAAADVTTGWLDPLVVS